MNRLSAETSPYLRQHRDNPVDWYPWGEEAFERARALDRPVLVSIGYSACHWCHVMAHESFEDEATAAMLNDRFVAIKVDREERPDIDAIYMEAVQALSGSGGWPLNVFLTPDGRPFFGGTYFPKRPMGATPAFASVLDAIATAWQERRDDLDVQANGLTSAVGDRLGPPPTSSVRPRGEELFAGFLQRFGELFDAEFGGIGTAPKFPQPPMLELVLRAAASGDPTAAAMTETTLAAMASGGIYDHLGGGFARYSTDRTWTVPHFEKMLYDQAGLARLYLHAYQVTGDRRWRQVVEETLEYVLRDLQLVDGGIASAEDADSEGEEGRFYAWTRDEFDDVLGTAATAARAWYGLDETPNFEGRFVLRRAAVGELVRPSEIERARAELFGARQRRVRPGLDDKVLTEWNAMTISVLSQAGATLGVAEWLDAAGAVATFLIGALRRPDGRWLRSWTAGRAQHLALLADYAWLVDCFTRLYEATGTTRWLERAQETATVLIALFGADDGGFFQTGADAEHLVVRPRDHYDGVIPAGSSIATAALWRVGTLASDDALVERARRGIDALGAIAARGPIALPCLIDSALSLDRGALEIVVTGQRRDLVDAVSERYLPETVLAWGEPTGPLFEGRPEGFAYVCERGACRLPAADTEALARELALALAARPR